jgi:hypothetical protein
MDPKKAKVKEKQIAKAVYGTEGQARLRGMLGRADDAEERSRGRVVVWRVRAVRS